jgi:hypothetical protein
VRDGTRDVWGVRGDPAEVPQGDAEVVRGESLKNLLPNWLLLLQTQRLPQRNDELGRGIPIEMQTVLNTLAHCVNHDPHQ